MQESPEWRVRQADERLLLPGAISGIAMGAVRLLALSVVP